MDDALDNDHSRTPSVEHVEGVIGNPQKGNQRIVAHRKQHCRDDVQRSEFATTTAEISNHRCAVFRPPIQDKAVCNVREDIDCKEQSVEAGRESAYANGAGKLHFAVVPDSEKGCVEEMLLDLWPYRCVVVRPIPLTFWAAHSEEMAYMRVAHIYPSEQ